MGVCVYVLYKRFTKLKNMFNDYKYCIYNKRWDWVGMGTLAVGTGNGVGMAKSVGMGWDEDQMNYCIIL